jgi:hypothetical protein
LERNVVQETGPLLFFWDSVPLNEGEADAEGAARDLTVGGGIERIGGRGGRPALADVADVADVELVAEGGEAEAVAIGKPVQYFEVMSFTFSSLLVTFSV